MARAEDGSQRQGTLRPRYKPEAVSELETRAGLRLRVRSARPNDAKSLGEFFSRITPDDLRFRFLSTLKEVSQARLAEMTEVDHENTEDYLAFGPESCGIVGAAMLAFDPRGERAEVAISVRSDCKGLGVGWTLLEYVARQARARGVHRLESVEDRSNHQAIELERDMGFTAEPFGDDPSLVLLTLRLA